MMGDAWIYANEPEPAREAAHLLAELGFSPHRVAINGSLRPKGEHGEVGRLPDVALVLCHGDAALGEVCARLREDQELGDVPVLLSVDAQAVGAAPGALDAHELIVAPFGEAELETRIARARRALRSADAGEVVRCGGLELNLALHEVSVDGEPVDLTYLEYELLKFLMTHPRRAFSRRTLLSRVWRYDYFGGARTVDVHVRRLRAKLGSEPASRIKTVRGVGYRFGD